MKLYKMIYTLLIVCLSSQVQSMYLQMPKNTPSIQLAYDNYATEYDQENDDSGSLYDYLISDDEENEPSKDATTMNTSKNLTLFDYIADKTLETKSPKQLFDPKNYKKEQTYLGFLLDSSVDAHGLSPLHSAALSNDSQRVLQLIQNSMNINAQDDYGRTPLHIAAETKNNNIAKIVIWSGADLTINDGNHKTAAQIAFESNNKELYDMIANAVILNWTN